jgi:hypothetical protein
MYEVCTITKCEVFFSVFLKENFRLNFEVVRPFLLHKISYDRLLECLSKL